MKKRTLSLLLVLFLLLTACGGRGAKGEEGELRLYFLTDQGRGDGAALDCERREGPEEPVTAEELMELLLAGPAEDGLRSPFPRGTALRGCRLQDGVATVDLSEAYGGLSGVDLSLADACVALTLCQLEGVEAVYLVVEGEPRPFRDQVLSPSELLLENGAGTPEELAVTLCFPAEQGLGWEERRLRLDMGDDPSIAALTALLEGPESRELRPLCPAETALLSLEREGDTFQVDLSAAWLDGEADPRRLRAVANTLAALNGEAEVTFLIEGQPLELFGALELTGPVTGEGA